jgi:hypothetical protein
MVLGAHALQAVKCRLKAESNEGNITLQVETVFRPISPGIAVGSLSNTTSYSLPNRYKQCKLGSRRLIMKGPLLLRSKHFLVSICRTIAVGSLTNPMRMHNTQFKLSWSRSVMKSTLLLRPKQFVVRTTPRIAVGSLSYTTWYSLRTCYK